MSSIRANDRFSLCTFTFADGRRCRTPRCSGDSPLCYFHTRKEAQARASETIGAEISELLSTGYLSAGDVSLALGRLFGAVVQGHVKPRQARTLAYLGQVLVQAVQLQHKEFIDAFGTTLWRQLIHNSFARDLSTPPRSAIRSSFRFASPSADPQPSQPASPSPQSSVPPPSARSRNPRPSRSSQSQGSGGFIPPAAPNTLTARFTPPLVPAPAQRQSPSACSPRNPQPAVAPPSTSCDLRVPLHASGNPQPSTLNSQPRTSIRPHAGSLIPLKSTLPQLSENKPL